MSNKRGLELSFGLIFSLILIAAIIGVAFYAINYFLNLGSCTEVSLFYQNFQEEIDEAWNSEITRDRFLGDLPNGIKAVCFYDRDLGVNIEPGGEEFEALEGYTHIGGNTFLFPPERACKQVSRTTEHVDFLELGEWHCFPVEKGKVTIPFEKGSFDSLVKIKRG